MIGPNYRANTPYVAASGASVYLAFIAPMPDGSRVPMLAISRDYGQTWAAPMSLEQHGSSTEVAMVAAGKHLVVTWVHSTAGAEKTGIVKTAVSHDAGKTIEISRVTDGSSRALEPLLAIADGKTYMVWRQLTIGHAQSPGFLAVLPSHASAFGRPRQITLENTRKISVAGDGSNIVLVYLEQNPITTNWRVFMQHSADGGVIFPRQRDLSGDTGLRGPLADRVHVPQAWVWGTHMSFVWSDASGVYVQSSDNSGGHISAPRLLGQGDFQLIAQETFCGPTRTAWSNTPIAERGGRRPPTSRTSALALLTPPASAADRTAPAAGREDSRRIDGRRCSGARRENRHCLRDSDVAIGISLS